MTAGIARPHVPEEELHAYSDGALSPAQNREIGEHLLGCLICRAQHADVEEMRARVSTLLAIASPPHIGAAPVLGNPRQARSRRWPRLIAAAAVAVIGVGGWISLRPVASSAHGPTKLAATSFGFSDIFQLGHSGLDQAAVRGRQLTIAGRTLASPQMEAGPAMLPFAAAAPLVGAAIDPVTTSEWTVATLDEALKAGNGKLARLADLPVKLVRIRPSAVGGRPTFMIRQELADGRTVWVFEGLEADIAPVDQVLQASGIAMSMATRTRPDYVGTGVETVPTVRMVRVVGYLPTDSLNALAQKLVLR